MWAIRVLSGPQSGQTFKLQTGRNSIGRGPENDIRINVPEISKEHAVIEVGDDGIVIQDRNSRNGTFVRGQRIKTHPLLVQDKFSLQEVLFEVVSVANNTHISRASVRSSVTQIRRRADSHARRVQDRAKNVSDNHTNPGASVAVIHAQGSRSELAGGHEFGSAAVDLDQIADQLNAPMQAQSNSLAGSGDNQKADGGLAPAGARFDINSLPGKIADQLESRVMPTFYGLTRKFEYRLVVGILFIVFALAVTALSTIPMSEMIQDTTLSEGKRRAESYARSLANLNRVALSGVQESTYTTRPTETEPGVVAAYILSAIDGRILAPADKRGTKSKLPYVNQVWKSTKESVAVLDDTRIGAAIPMQKFSGELGQTTVAFAVIIYDQSTIAIDSGQSFSLFLKSLFIAALVGGLLYFVLIRLIERPIETLNQQLDVALRNNAQEIELEVLHPQLRQLATNVSAAMNQIRTSRSQSAGGPTAIPLNIREIEAKQLVEALPFAGLAIRAVDNRVIVDNEQLRQILETSTSLTDKSLDAIQEQSFRGCLSGMLPKVKENPGENISDSFTTAGQKAYQVSAQAFMLTQEEVAYILLTVQKLDGGGGH